MVKKHRGAPAAAQGKGPEIVQPEAAPETAPPATVPPEAASSAVGAVLEPPEQMIERLERELADVKDRYLRSAADLENFKRRASRERAEMWHRVQADVISHLLEVIDDLGRVAHLDPAQTTAESLHEGVLLVERKLLKVLEGAGLERVDPKGAPFDPNAHEAVTTIPAPSAESDGTVGMVFQHGYRFGGALLRPARVAVYTWAAPATDLAATDQAATDQAAS